MAPSGQSESFRHDDSAADRAAAAAAIGPISLSATLKPALPPWPWIPCMIGPPARNRRVPAPQVGARLPTVPSFVARPVAKRAKLPRSRARIPPPYQDVAAGGATVEARGAEGGPDPVKRSLPTSVAFDSEGASCADAWGATAIVRRDRAADIILTGSMGSRLHPSCRPTIRRKFDGCRRNEPNARLTGTGESPCVKRRRASRVTCVLLLHYTRRLASGIRAQTAGRWLRRAGLQTSVSAKFVRSSRSRPHRKPRRSCHRGARALREPGTWCRAHRWR